MNILFVHQNFPSQFVHLAPALARLGHQVVALKNSEGDSIHWNGVTILPYCVLRSSNPDIHPLASDFENIMIRADACYQAAAYLDSQGFTPDIVISHHGWGESFFLNEIWPQAKFAIYCEYFYKVHGSDFNFDPEFDDRKNLDKRRVIVKNASNLFHFQFAHAGVSPTRWQADTYPATFREKISVIHDGIDTTISIPNKNASILFSDGSSFTKKNKIVTFIARNLEPLRGYHIFMRALPEVLSTISSAQILIVGNDKNGYGVRSRDGRTWKDIFLEEITSQLDENQKSRIHFLGQLSYSDYLKVLQISAAHVYLTYPFVLSWSLLEAMSVGCTVIASDTDPVREIIKHNDNGLLFNFFDSNELAHHIINVLTHRNESKYLGAKARKYIESNYDLNTIMLPKQIDWVDSILNNK